MFEQVLLVKEIHWQAVRFLGFCALETASAE